MSWTDEEKRALLDAHNKSTDDREQVWMVARRAVELVAARGGTMTAERIADLKESMEALAKNRPAVAEEIGEALRSMTTQGATVATLQAKLESCEAALQDAQTDGALWEAEAQRVRAEAATLQAEVEKALSGYESANTEIVRERSALRAEVERLKAEKTGALTIAKNATQDSDLRGVMRQKMATIAEMAESVASWQAAAESAESHLAAIRERAIALGDVARAVDLDSFRRWVLEDGAPPSTSKLADLESAISHLAIDEDPAPDLQPSNALREVAARIQKMKAEIFQLRAEAETQRQRAENRAATITNQDAMIADLRRELELAREGSRDPQSNQ